jgi:U3 small nucleolar RNA-associated protein 20
VLPWAPYYALLTNHIRLIATKPEAIRVLLRIVCGIIAEYHFFEKPAVAIDDAMDVVVVEKVVEDVAMEGVEEVTVEEEEEEEKEVDEDDEDEEKEEEDDDEEEANVVPANIVKVLRTKVIPSLRKHLMGEDEKVRTPVALAVVKILKLLPTEAVKVELPSVVGAICTLLKNHLNYVRDGARAALVEVATELGAGCIGMIVSAMRGVLRQGFHLHILGYTVHALLAKLVPPAAVGEFDCALYALLPVIEADMLGDIAAEKEVAAITAKMKECKRTRAYDALELLASRVNFRTHLGELLSPVRNYLPAANALKIRTKLETALQSISVGLMANPDLPLVDLMVFVHATVDDGLTADHHSNTAALPLVGGVGRRVGREMEETLKIRPTRNPRGDPDADTAAAAAAAAPPNYHLVVQFALTLLHMALKRRAGGRQLQQEGPLIGPLVPLMSRGLESRRVPVVSLCLKCLCFMVPLHQIPNLETEADRLCRRVFDMMRGTSKMSSPLIQDGFKLVASLIRACPEYTMSATNLKFLLSVAFVDLEDSNNRATTFSLLKAIVMRKAVLPEMYDLMTRVSQHLVRSQQAPVRALCSQVFLMFLLDYPLGEKRLRQHLEFLVRNLGYEHAAGRAAVVEMLEAVVAKFPFAVLEEYAEFFFVPLVTRLVNDQDAECRRLVGRLMKALLVRLGGEGSAKQARVRAYTVAWLANGKDPLLQRAAAQVLGLMVDVAGERSGQFCDEFLPPLHRLLAAAAGVKEDAEGDEKGGSDEGGEGGEGGGEATKWQPTYYGLLLLEKLVQASPAAIDERAEQFAPLWDACLSTALLLHGHQ